jgi:DNA-3-methyladenine glycosylase II
LLSFRLDGSYAPVAVALHDAGDDLVVHAAGSRDARAIGAQVTRMLGLDADGDAWAAVGARDPVVGRLQRAFPGFFTAAKASPYDAATWAVIAPRLQIASAARIKIALAKAHGDRVELDGRIHHVFPAPATLAQLDAFEGLAEHKVARLRGIAAAALAGRLDAERLRAMTPEAALADLQTLHGIGPWGASHIYYRGAAVVDELPIAEPRVLHALALAYGLHEPSIADCQRVALGWRPFRMWVAILLMRELAGTAQWRAPHLRAARAKVATRV